MDCASRRPMRRHWIGVAPWAGLLAAGLAAAWESGPSGAPAQDVGAPAAPGGLDLEYTPLPDWFEFQPKATVEAWVAEADTKSMMGHAWELWGALTSPSGQELNGQGMPVYETWYDRDEALAPPAAPGLLRAARRRRNFEPPRQLIHSGALRRQAIRLGATPDADRPVFTLFDNVKYNREIYAHIQDPANRYYDPAVLQALNSGWGDTPLADRKLKDFPDTSVMLKPVYIYASATAPTQTGIWTGPADSTTPSTPSPGSWTSQVWVIPAGFRADGFDPGGLPTVPIERFFALKLTAAEVNFLQQQSVVPASARPGDFMLLVAMHVSSREIDNWTWQTFWWTFRRPTVPEPIRGRVAAPFDNYQPMVSYSFLTAEDNPDSLNAVCFNPYLEAGFDNAVFAKPGQLGIESNCMSCHRCAAWPGASSKYIANGAIDPGDPFFFTGTTKTDFLWGIPFGVSQPSSSN